MAHTLPSTDFMRALLRDTFAVRDSLQMTPETLTAITSRLTERHHSCECGDYCEWCAPWACGATSQQIMDCYLEPWSSREGYERDAAKFPEFFAVLATAEYHEHWRR